MPSCGYCIDGQYSEAKDVMHKPPVKLEHIFASTGGHMFRPLEAPHGARSTINPGLTDVSPSLVQIDSGTAP